MKKPVTITVTISLPAAKAVYSMIEEFIESRRTTGVTDVQLDRKIPGLFDLFDTLAFLISTAGL